MSDDSKGSTQTVAPAEPSSSPHRKPSTKEKSWEQKTLAPTLAKNPERQAEFTTVSGFPIQRLYTPADLSGWNPDRDLGYPAEPPYTRGIHSTKHRRRLWTKHKFAGFRAAQYTNQPLRYLL